MQYSEDLEYQGENKGLNTAAYKEDTNTLNYLNPRVGFIRKVYGILSAQLLLTVLMCVLAMSSTSYFSFMVSGAGLTLLIISCITAFIVSIALVCFRSIGRTVPTNYILLTIFTMCEGYAVSYSCAMTSPRIVFMAATMTLMITISLTIYAMTTKNDFTYCGGMLFICGMVMFVVAIFLLFTNNPVAHIIYSAFGVILYGIYLIYDTQLIMGNKQHELTLDDYVLGALFIYMDVILIFLYILDILNRLKD